MDNKKTISHLNSKAWYRLLKVFFIVIFCFFALLSIFSIYKLQDNPKKYIIKCVWDNQSYVDGEVWADMPFSSDVSKWSADERLSAAAGCLTDKERDIFHAEVKQLPLEYPTIYSGVSETDKEFTAMLHVANIWDNNAFKVKTPIQTTKGIFQFLGMIVVVLFIELIIFEIIRRVFYYIVLGSIKPEK